MEEEKLLGSLEIDVVKFPKGFQKEEGLNWQHWSML
jgi:hypothetical protein